MAKINNLIFTTKKNYGLLFVHSINLANIIYIEDYCQIYYTSVGLAALVLILAQSPNSNSGSGSKYIPLDKLFFMCSEVVH